MEPITVETTISAPKEKVWDVYTNPEHMTKWNHASDDWHSPKAQIDLRVGGVFNVRMEAKDGSAGFDFEGIYDEVIPNERISYKMGDGRKVKILFTEADGRTHVITTFDPETENPAEMQREGWQSILDNFKKYVESN